MRACFVLPNLSLSGGMGVAAGHAQRLRERHALEVDLVAVNRVGHGAIGFDAARERRYDVAVATWWETVGLLSALRARRHVVLLQGFEHRFYPPDSHFDRLAAEATLALPVDFVAVAAWLRDHLLHLRPGARCHVVPNGIDRGVFAAPREVRRRGPLRILVEGQPSLWFKGVDEALAATRAMREPAHVTLVALDPIQAEGAAADRVVGGLDAAGMAALYRENDVLVKLSRVEGLGMAPLEGFESGLPCVLTPYTGHEEYAVRGQNALVVGMDDVPGTAATLDLLARDRSLLARLSTGARRTASSRLTAEQSSAMLASVMAEIAATHSPPVADTALLGRTLALAATIGRGRLRRIGSLEGALEDARAHVRELSESRDECATMLDQARAELDAIRSTPAFRAVRAARRLTRGVRR